MSSPQQGAYKPRTKKPKATRSVSFSLPALPFPLASFLHPLRSASSQWLVLPVLLMVSILFRWAVGLGSYSGGFILSVYRGSRGVFFIYIFWLTEGNIGMAAPPMHGDFEAQRHWMEVTTNLPAKEWYWHDLEWWGLDYPPLTAYHSWLLGVMCESPRSRY